MILSVKPLTLSQASFHESIMGLEDAFKRGEKDFYFGQRVTVQPDLSQTKDIKKRLKFMTIALTPNEEVDDDTRTKLLHKADKISLMLFFGGIHLTDLVLKEGEPPYETIAEKAIEATCPYKDGSMLSKEWQRGYNVGYNNRLNYVKFTERDKT